VAELMRRWSVRARATVLASVVVGLTLALGALLLVVTLDESLTRSGDDLAKTRARDLASLAATGALPDRLSTIDGESVGQVVDGTGHVLAASPNLRGAGPISSFHPQGDVPVVLTVNDAPDDNETENYRIWALTAQARDGGPLTVYVGNSLESVGEASRSLRRSLLMGVPFMLALLAFCTWLVIGRALRPVEKIRAEVATISDEALDRRVTVPGSDDEVGRLAATMNQMLDRLESASRRQHAFVADASHELQSPLAALRTQLEVALRHPAGADWQATAGDLLADTDRMERLVRNLLFLAREQDNDRPRASEPFDLDDIVLEEAARSRPTAAVAVDTSRVSGAPVQGSRDELRRLVRNLLDNALTHAVTSVRLTVSCDDHVARLDVQDDGPGVPQADRERVFDRFYRADASRSTATGGTGLGLAIARAIAERHDGSLEIVGGDSGAHFVLLLPLSGDR
jgi:signal transduction histidine kinase